MNLLDIHTHHYQVFEPELQQPNTSIKQVLNRYPFGIEQEDDFVNLDYISCGIHPWYSENFESQLEILNRVVLDNRLVAIGESGLDKLRGLELKEQTFILEKQIEISENYEKPLIIHCVKAWAELIDIKKKKKPHQPWILHGYRGNPDMTQQLIRHGFMFSIGEKFNIEAIRVIPPHLLFCETDESNLSIIEIYRLVSDTLNIEIDSLAELISLNIKRNFPTIN